MSMEILDAGQIDVVMPNGIPIYHGAVGVEVPANAALELAQNVRIDDSPVFPLALATVSLKTNAAAPDFPEGTSLVEALGFQRLANGEFQSIFGKVVAVDSPRAPQIVPVKDLAEFMGFRKRGHVRVLLGFRAARQGTGSLAWFDERFDASDEESEKAYLVMVEELKPVCDVICREWELVLKRAS